MSAAPALPRVVLAPIFALWLGLGIWSKVALGVTLVFFVSHESSFKHTVLNEVEGLDKGRHHTSSFGQFHAWILHDLAFIFTSRARILRKQNGGRQIPPQRRNKHGWNRVKQ